MCHTSVWPCRICCISVYEGVAAGAAGQGATSNGEETHDRGMETLLGAPGLKLLDERRMLQAHDFDMRCISWDLQAMQCQLC